LNRKPPRSVIIVSVNTIYFQCHKALARSGLWRAETQIPRTDLPSTGTMLAALSTGEGFDAKEYDRNYPKHLKKTIY
ncbi:MAG: pyridoxamine 5'-phosphate oxidase family protein, partial [Gammaproteobacteria bacterium]|nr:pyridoxamine 5'-phosphate oxidase family protein [Gammaproteobacteria bacterium]